MYDFQINNYFQNYVLKNTLFKFLTSSLIFFQPKNY